MNKLLITFIFASLSFGAFSWDLNSIELEKNGKKIIFGKSESVLNGKDRGDWMCTTKAFGKRYFGEGATKGLAKKKSVESCQDSHHGMHCRKTKCEKG